MPYIFTTLRVYIFRHYIYRLCITHSLSERMKMLCNLNHNINRKTRFWNFFKLCIFIYLFFSTYRRVHLCIRYKKTKKYKTWVSIFFLFKFLYEFFHTCSTYSRNYLSSIKQRWHWDGESYLCPILSVKCVSLSSNSLSKFLLRWVFVLFSQVSDVNAHELIYSHHLKACASLLFEYSFPSFDQVSIPISVKWEDEIFVESAISKSTTYDLFFLF